MEDFEVLTDDQIEHLFDDDSQGAEETPPATKQEKNNEEIEDTTEVDVDNLFTKPESVGGGKENKEEKEEASTSAKETSTSPNNFFSSIADALVEDGVTPDLDTSNIKDAESFAEAMKSYYENQLSETQKRINDALNSGVEPSEIRYFENTLKNLNGITDEFIEDEKNEEFRKRAIYQDLINRGYSKEDATDELQEILDNGTDVKKAKRAITSMKDFYGKKYKEVLASAKEEAAQEEREQKERMANLKKDLLESEKVFGDLEVSKDYRQKAYDAISKPVWKDPETGDVYTAIQKYEREHKDEFIKKLGLLFVLTNSFESIDSLVKGKVNKESKKALRDLESKLNNTRRNSDGNLDFTSGVDDEESAFRGFSLDI